jgi:hypothetical protein
MFVRCEELTRVALTLKIRPVIGGQSFSAISLCCRSCPCGGLGKIIRVGGEGGAGGEKGASAVGRRRGAGFRSEGENFSFRIYPASTMLPVPESRAVPVRG